MKRISRNSTSKSGVLLKQADVRTWDAVQERYITETVLVPVGFKKSVKTMRKK